MHFFNRICHKEGRNLTVYVDYWEVNAVDTRNFYLLPPIDECIHSLDYAMTFSTLYSNCGYGQTEVHKTDREKTVFTLHHGL